MKTRKTKRPELSPGDLVTWTHIVPCGRSINLTTREGKVMGRSAADPECYTVRWRGRRLRIHETHLRRQGERTTLTEFVMGREEAQEG